MRNARRSMLSGAVLCGLAVLSVSGHAREGTKEARLPDAVRKTFTSRFPGGEIEKVESEEEGGVTVFDIEFKDGGVEKETDIAADGTMLEHTVVIDAKAVPSAAMKAIREAAAGATMGRIEEISMSHETRGGKVVKLPATVTHYEVELRRGGRKAEIVVDPKGGVIEPADFGDGK